MHDGSYMIPICIDTVGECSGWSEPNFGYREADNDGTTNTAHEEISDYLIKTTECFFICDSGLKKVEDLDGLPGHNPAAILAPPTSVQDQSLCNEGIVVGIESGKKVDCFDTFGNEYRELNITHYVDDVDVCRNNAGKDQQSDSIEKNIEYEKGLKEEVINYDKDKGKEDVAQSFKPVVFGEEPTKVLEFKKGTHVKDLDKNKRVRNMVTRSTNKAAHTSANPKPVPKTSRISKGGLKYDQHSMTQILAESLACNKLEDAPKVIDQCKDDQNIVAKNKLKQNRKENLAEDNSMTSKVRAFS